METLHRRLTEIRGTSPDSYRAFVVLNYIALIAIAAHTLLVPLFAWMGVGSMALFNVVGCAIWVLAFLCNRNGRHGLGFVLGFAEVLAHSFLGVAVLGWGSGFQYHILPTVLFILFHHVWRDISRVLVPILLCALYVALNLYSRTVGPMVAAHPADLNLLNALNVIVLFVALSVFADKYRMAVRTGEQELKEANRELDVLAGTDSLTGLLNRRHMRQRIDIEMARFERTGKSFALVMADIDDFKSFNDRHGHECGDRVLVSVANLMKESLRRRDQLARWGGEEFLMLLPETGLEGGERLPSESGRRSRALRSLITGTGCQSR